MKKNEMFRNLLTTSLRNLKRNKSYILINIIGLGIGIACCLVAYTMLKHELTFDNFHENPENIFRVVERYEGDYGVEFSGIVPNAMPQGVLDNISNLDGILTAYGPFEGLITVNYNKNRNQFEEPAIVFANSDFLNFLNFKLISGAPTSALDQPGTCYLTKQKAEKYFGNENPIGKFLIYNDNSKLEIVGVLENTPKNTSVPFDILVSAETLKKTTGDYLNSWDAYWQCTLLVITRQVEQLKKIEKQITEFAHSHMDQRAQERKTYYLQPLSEVHTDAKYGNAVHYVAPAEILAGLVILASIILIASILNYINLATAQASKRSKEIGIRKTLGSSRRSIVIQFFVETLLITLIATLMGTTIAQFFILKMNEKLNIVIYEIGFDNTTILFAFLIAILVSTLASLYPAKVLSKYEPSTAIKNQISVSSGSGNMNLRKFLIVIQFVIANMIIISTVIVTAQMLHVNNKDLGFQREHIMEVEIPWSEQDNLQNIKNDLLSLNGVEKVSTMYGAPQSLYNWNSNYEVVGEEVTEKLNANIKFIDKEYLDLFGIPIIAGRNITDTYTNDSAVNLIVNKEFLKRVNLQPEEGVGKTVISLGSWKGKINGVVADFNNWSLQHKLGPVLFIYKPSQIKNLAVKYKSGKNEQDMKQEIKKVFRNYSTDRYIKSELITDNMEKNYVLESLVFDIFRVFAILSILIAVFGLYGLVSFMAVAKRKSISIRKVFGATSRNIINLLLKEFVLLMAVAFIISAPIGYLIANSWLENFIYKIDITTLYFAISLAILILIVFLTSFMRSYKAATANPSSELRYE